MHQLYDFCKQKGIDTRVVESVIALEFAPDNGNFLEEFHKIGSMYEDINQWLGKVNEKNENALLLEILVELYKKVARLERKIMQQEEDLLPLEYKSKIVALGHGVVFIEDAILEEGMSYYLRFVLPSFSDRIMPVFAKALSENVLQIVRFHTRDMQDFDSYIANTEMEAIRAKRYL